jgi:hypothetical protein
MGALDSEVTRADDHSELHRLAALYARAVDMRDADILLGVFDPDARLRVYDPAGVEPPRSDMRGHEQLARITRSIARYDKTFHLVGNATYDITGDDAMGEVYCIAHHLSTEGDTTTDRVMYIRYHDTYRRNGAGWKIVDRRVDVDWTESR